MYAWDDRVGGGGSAGEDVDEVDAEGSLLEAELAGERELRIAVDDEHPPVAGGEQYADVGGGGGLADAALLVLCRVAGYAGLPGSTPSFVLL